MTDPAQPGASTPAPGAGFPPELDGVAIRVGGKLLAWFADAESAAEWATDTHFGEWLIHPCSIPDRPPFSKEQIAQARVLGEELLKRFVPGRFAD